MIVALLGDVGVGHAVEPSVPPKIEAVSDALTVVLCHTETATASVPDERANSDSSANWTGVTDLGR